MMPLFADLRALRGDRTGAAAIEAAFVIPILLAMSLGGVEVSQIVARHTELRTAAAEAVAIAVSSPPTSQSHYDIIEDILEESTGLPDADVVLTEMFRCNDDPDMTDDETDCDADDVVATFLEIEMQETYSPTWTDFGIGSDINFAVERTVQIS